MNILAIIYNNIKLVAKAKGIKVGDIEAAAGASPGYLSRLGSKEEDKSSSVVMDLLISASKMLNISIDTLISRDLTTATASEAKIVNLMYKLIEETDRGQRIWTMEPEEAFDGRLPMEQMHPLSVLGDFIDEENGRRESPHFLSRFSDSAYLDGVSYKTTLIGSTVFYIIKTRVQYDDGRHGYQDAYELYLCRYNKVEPLCNCIDQNPVLYPLANQLYTTAKVSTRNGGISMASASLIDEYLKD